MLLIAVGVSTSSRSSSYAVSEDFFKLGSKYGQGIRKRVAAGSIHRLDPVASGGFRFQWSVEVFLLRQKTTMHGVGTAKLVVVFRYMRSREPRHSGPMQCGTGLFRLQHMHRFATSGTLQNSWEKLRGDNRSEQQVVDSLNGGGGDINGVGQICLLLRVVADLLTKPTT
uniref:Uncharacterized protein n=1 Tax=Physcomitrium patens TaxID=3218 RepID=A0A2K1K1X7_PHYPA|nr:hypothetical protein PHYPA_012249 [Physcomitrium patens]